MKQSSSKATSGKSTQSHRVRIIGGHWRSRLIKVIDQDGLRPTTDRVRETLFNWLGQQLHGQVCLDMFAGSGVLGLESLSRGAAHVTFIEAHAQVFRTLKDNLETLGTLPQEPKIELLHLNALNWAKSVGTQKYDVVFVDPPFSDPKILDQALSFVNQLVKPAISSVIYVECPSETADSVILQALPDWQIDRQLVAGSAKASLLRKIER